LNQDTPNPVDKNTSDSVDQKTPVFDELSKYVKNIRKVLTLVLALGLATPALPSKAEAAKWSGCIDFSEQIKKTHEDDIKIDQGITIRGIESEERRKRMERYKQEAEIARKKAEAARKEAEVLREKSIQILTEEYIKTHAEKGYAITEEQARSMATKRYDENLSRIKKK